ncbi:ABC transporter substrate-binding protein [Candidatus Odyssella thessalonicensis]|uniref:ABC transporter substrate-binding protein n=1 Tax=Candidatus Odyssella thessalonicensis TaxID=84647 RepID=UPI000225B933|nr:ABC transporter substrate-binding protein [Candidatus Odyssella thessalonicensis]
MKILAILWFVVTACWATPVTVYLEGRLTSTYAVLIVAQQAGLFAEQGLQVSLVAGRGEEEGNRQVVAGTADFTISKLSSHLIRCCNHSLPLVRVATLIDRPLQCLIVQPKINSVAELKGKRLGYRASLGEIAPLKLATILANVNLKITDITLVPLTSSLVPAFLSGDVDAVLGECCPYELNNIYSHCSQVHIFYYEERGIDGYDPIIIIAHRHRPENVKAFVTALQRAVDLMHYSPEQSWKYYSQGVSEKASYANKTIFMQIAPLLVKDVGLLSIEKYNRLAQFMKRSGILTKDIPQSYAIDGSL